MLVLLSRSVVSDSSRPHGLQPTRLPRPWDSPGKNTGVCCHFLLQSMKVKSESEVARSCPTLHDPMDCSPPGSSIHRIFLARALEWVASPFSRGSSQPRDPTWVSCIAGGFFTNWTTREAAMENYSAIKRIKFDICSNINGLGGHYAKWNKAEKGKYYMPSSYVESKNTTKQ